jgi:hypothetical protein
MQRDVLQHSCITNNLLASDARLELLEENLHLLGNKVLDLGLELVELTANLVGGTASSLLSLLELIGKLLLNLRDRRNGDGVRRLLLSSLRLVATVLNNLGEVLGTTTVPGENVFGVGGNVRESTDSTDGDEVGLELLGSDIRNSVGRVLGRLQRQVVGQKTSNVGRSHRGTRDGVGGMLRADPGGQDVETGGEDVIALSEVGEVRTLVVQGGSTDSDGVGSSGRRVLAGVGIVVTGGNGKVDTGINSSVDSLVEDSRLATSQTHVGGRTLEALLLTILCGLDSVRVSLSSPLDTLDDVGHGARAVRAEDLDGVDVGLLGNTVLLASNSTGAVGAVTVAILIGIAVGDGLAPVGTAFEVDVLDVCTSVDDIDVNTLATIGSIEVLVECAEAQRVAVRDTGKTPGGVLLRLVVIAAHGVDL